MPGKRKPTAQKGSRTSKRQTRNSHSETWKPWQVLAAEQGVQPVEDMEKFIEEFRELWPDDKEIDEFLAWLQESRREGRKDR
jgi:hypothetical protein